MASMSIGVRTVRRVGSSLVVTIPPAAAQALGIDEGDQVEVALRSAERRPQVDPAPPAVPVSAVPSPGLGEVDQVEAALRSVGRRPDLDPALRAAMDAAWLQIEPGLRYLANR